MSFDRAGVGALDYLPCRYATSRLVFRGPPRNTDGTHVAVLGGTESYGKFMDSPWPDLLEQLVGGPVANLSQLNAGPDVFLGDRAVTDLCRSARATVIELTGAQNISNRYYAVHPRRNDRFLRASTQLKSLYPEVDFTRYHFTGHLLQGLAAADPDRFSLVESELKEGWTTRLHRLIEHVGGRTVLLWLADHRAGSSGVDALRRSAAALIDREMIDLLRPRAAAVVEIVADADEIGLGQADLVHSPLEAPAAAAMLGTVVHKRAARELAAVLRGLRAAAPPGTALP